MRPQSRKFRTDTNAASEVIGMVLLLAVLITFFTIIQVSVVPNWNKKVEAEEIKVTYDDMMFLPSDIEDVALHGTPKTCTVQLGARYPDRMIFLNPGPGTAGTLAVEEAPAWVTVTYKNDTDTCTETFESKRITYQMAGTINSPKLVYEHGVIISDWGTANLTRDEQTLIDRNENLYIPIVNGSSHSKSAIDSEAMDIYPYLYDDSISVNWVNVTLDTEYPDLWNDKLFNASEVLEELNLQDTDLGVDIDDKKIYINNTAPKYLKYPDQTASGPLYAGMISYSAEDPDAAGSGTGLWISGEGTDIMAIGSRVANIPCSANATAILIQDIVVDELLKSKLGSNFATISVTDTNWNWWKVLINFKYDNVKKIDTIVVRSDNGTSNYLDTSFVFDQYTILDLFDPGNFDLTAGLYQEANVGSNNRLVTNLADDTLQKNLAVISFRLMVDDD